MIYIKALSIQNCKTLVYAHQCYSEAGMQSGFYSCRINNEHLFVPDGNWIVWHLNPVVCEVLSDDDFRNQYIPYNDLPLSMKKLADMYPDYEKWVEDINQINDS